MTDSMLVSRSERTVSRGLLHPLEGLASGWRTSKRQEKPHWLGNLRGPPPSDLGLLRAGLYHPTRLGAPERPYFLITLGFPEGKVSAFSAGGLPKAGTTPPRGRAVGHVTCEGVTGISWARFLAWTLGPPPPPTSRPCPTHSARSVRCLRLHLGGGPLYCSPGRWLPGGLHGVLYQGGR